MQVRPSLLPLLLMVIAPLAAQTPDLKLPELAVYSPRVANQAPVATFAMPVSSLRFEPLVDIQARNFAEGQADVTIRGGIFENSGFKLGASTLFDPQTGHYFAELPVAPVMLSVPAVLTGVDNALAGTNATVGTIAYGWRPIRSAGFAAVGLGEFGFLQGEFYQGYVSPGRRAGRTLAADVAWSHSEGDGSLPNGDHTLNRLNARWQWSGAQSQTDVFVGYQEKLFGWPNLYTPFNSAESENLKTLLVMLNHRVDLGGGDFWQVGSYYRRNRDDYAFNRFAPVGAVHPYNHTTWVQGLAAEGKREVSEARVGWRAEVLADDLRSTSLTAGAYHTRTLAKLAIVPEKAWSLRDGAMLTARAGAAYDDSNRGKGAFSPVFELARDDASAVLSHLYLNYAEATQVPTYTATNSAAGAGLFRGNPTLGRETSRNLELGARGTLTGWSLQGAIFHRQDDDLVDWTFRRGVTARTANAVDIATAGLELVARRSWASVDLVVGYMALTKDADYRSATVDASFYALNYAKHRLSVAVTVRLTREFTVRWDNVARIQAPNLLRTIGGDHALTSSLGLAYRPAVCRRLELAVQTDNLWDSDYQEVPAVPAARRQTSARVSYAW